jgi:hypothetical protein
MPLLIIARESEEYHEQQRNRTYTGTNRIRKPGEQLAVFAAMN